MFLHVDEPETVVDASWPRGSATARGSASPPSCSRTPARGCASASPTSASSRRPAGWSACSAFPSYERRFKGHHGGLTPEESETWIGMMV